MSRETCGDYGCAETGGYVAALSFVEYGCDDAFAFANFGKAPIAKADSAPETGKVDLHRVEIATIAATREDG